MSIIKVLIKSTFLAIVALILGKAFDKLFREKSITFESPN